MIIKIFFMMTVKFIYFDHSSLTAYRAIFKNADNQETKWKSAKIMLLKILYYPKSRVPKMLHCQLCSTCYTAVAWIHNSLKSTSK